jgi:hypothetical protein
VRSLPIMRTRRAGGGQDAVLVAAQSPSPVVRHLAIYSGAEVTLSFCILPAMRSPWQLHRLKGYRCPDKGGG